MSSNRKIAFANNEIYHVFNRGVEKRKTFTNNKEFMRAKNTLEYYRFANLPLRFSHFVKLDKNTQSFALNRIHLLEKYIEIQAFCFMPNHFHFLLKQIKTNGISKFMANFTNSYTKYFNTKHDRVGPLFQGLFKAVHIEKDEQLIHVSRYIHLNPVSAFLIESKDLQHYAWSSYRDYVNTQSNLIVENKTVLEFFKSQKQYEQFVLDQVDYARTLEAIKDVIFD
jgi:putative transposase